MKTTIDSAGRLVIPKATRDRLGLAAGVALELREVDGKLQIEATKTPMTLKALGHSTTAVPECPLPPLTDEMVRDTIEQTRR